MPFAGGYPAGLEYVWKYEFEMMNEPASLEKYWASLLVKVQWSTRSFAPLSWSVVVWPPRARPAPNSRSHQMSRLSLLAVNAIDP